MSKEGEACGLDLVRMSEATVLPQQPSVFVFIFSFDLAKTDFPTQKEIKAS